MTSLELIGFQKTIKELVSDNKRSQAFDLLDHFFRKARSLEEFDAIGQLSLDTEHRDLYLRCAETSYAVAFNTQQKYAARTNLIKAYNVMNWPEKALFLIDKQLLLTPDDFNMLCEKAANTALMGDRVSSEAILNDLIEKYPEKRQTLELMFSTKHLRSGELQRGVRLFIEGYKKKNTLFEQRLNMSRWDGVARAGRIVYVEAEGGIGDELINVRFFENIKKMGMHPILVCPDNEFYKDKNSLFSRLGVQILSESFSIDRKQFWTPMMSLPADLNLTENDLWKKPYIHPIRQEKNKIDSNKFKIGIKCSGNPFFTQDEYRKIPLDLMLSYLPKDAEIYYIDKLTGHDGTIDLGDRINSWEDTLDFIDQMDCIVSSCTSLVHAAGAMGKTTFVAVPIAEYYIWTTSKQDGSSPWYGDNFYVARQKKVRDWSEPLTDIGNRVRKLLESK